MTKGDLVSAVAKAAGLNKSTAGEAVDAIFDSLARAIKKDKRFQVPGFGTFTVRSRKARKGRNPQTGDEIAIRASRTVGFTPLWRPFVFGLDRERAGQYNSATRIGCLGILWH